MAAQAQTKQDDVAGDAAAERKVVNLPLRLSPKTHEALRTLAFERRVSIHSLLLEGVAEVLRRNGK